MKTMTSRERFLTAMRAGGIPDRVPVTPDISNYIPCKRTGRPFWDIYFKNEVPLWKAYLNAADYAKNLAELEKAIAPSIELMLADQGIEIPKGGQVK